MESIAMKGVFTLVTLIAICTFATGCGGGPDVETPEPTAEELEENVEIGGLPR